MALFKIIQRETFSENCKEINGVSLIRKEDGLLHVKSKLLNKDDTELFRWPILLPNSHPIVDQLITKVHRLHGHIGIQALLGKLRKRFWILQGRRAVRRVIKQCLQCKRYEATPLHVDAAALPKRRVTVTRSFETTGIDLTGPLYLKNGTKVWIVLYTCAVFRCIELDIVSSLSTETFLGTLQRFIHRFGRPSTIYTDNGTNFLGVENLFKSLDWETIQKKVEVQKIQWIFNPPTAAWWDGWWERLVGSVKRLLRRMLGRAKLNEEALRTCLTAVTASINDRPLTTVTEDPEHLIPLTPAMFLRGPIVTSFPDGIEVEYQECFRRTATLQEELKGRLRREYLSLLVQRAKENKSPAPHVGDIVLVGADNRKQIDWPMGRILELIPGKDGLIRVARVKTATGSLIRPLQLLYQLEIILMDLSHLLEKMAISKEDPAPKKSKELKNTNPLVRMGEPTTLPQPMVKTRCGRTVIRPQRFQ